MNQHLLRIYVHVICLVCTTKETVVGCECFKICNLQKFLSTESLQNYIAL